MDQFPERDTNLSNEEALRARLAEVEAERSALIDDNEELASALEEAYCENVQLREENERVVEDDLALVKWSFRHGFSYQRRAEEAQKEVDRVKEEAKKEIDEVKEKSQIDSLTGVWKREVLFDKYESVVYRSRSTRKQDMFTKDMVKNGLLFIDIDKFKDINDTYGHDVGDRVLTAVAAAIKGSTRRDNDTVVRWGGEEFAVLVEGISSSDTLIVSEKILKAVSQAIEIDDHIISTSVSIGVSDIDPNLNMAEIFKKADNAMYQAKRLGGNQIQFANGNFEPKAQK